jgi:hypothetical protein
MSLGRIGRILLFFVVVLALVVGCGGGKDGGDPALQRKEAELGEIHEIYQEYMKINNQRPPKQMSDLKQKQFEVVNPQGFGAMQRGQYVVVWGVDINKDSGAVLAYEKDAPKKGGVVLTASGKVKMMSAEDLQAALKGR